MFRAQTDGRCQLQRLIPKAPEQDAERWAKQWIEEIDTRTPDFGPDVQTRVYALSWRFVTNGGQDDGAIRPVIGARGWPFYPGSSMKGIFRSACTPAQANCYCGERLSGGDFNPGLLRFHGGYPTSRRWTDRLVDIVHPQQDWQVKQDRKAAGAFVQLSLYKPELRFGISSLRPLADDEWNTIWQIWERAMGAGLGCRVCAGYGQPAQGSGDVLYRTRLQGQGQAAKLLDGSGEFRPNSFRAAIRGHALRIFGGLTDAETADQLVEELFGGIRGSATVGLLAMRFQENSPSLDIAGQDSYAQPVYTVEGELSWLLTRPLEDATHRDRLKKLIAGLTRFAMVLGGFGKSWRRADHRLFLPEYGEDGHKPLIGCHWQWSGDLALRQDVRVRKLAQVGEFIDSVRQRARTWMQQRGKLPQPRQHADWREVWHPDTVQVWGRQVEEAEDCEAIRWLHGPYREAIPTAGIREGSIYRSSLTGQMGVIGRLWHRMYPRVRLIKNPQDPKGKPLAKRTREYFELLTLFPDGSAKSDAFLTFLESEQKRFQRLWPLG